jgi:TNF(Tumour Necrosis Factor) family.
MIAPWYADEHGAGDFLLSKFQLREGNGAVEVLEKGLYYIYAQVREYRTHVMFKC